MNLFKRWTERRRIDRELAEEMDAHIRERADQLMEDGQSADEAIRDARRQFGNAGLQYERSRDAWGWRGVEEFLADLRFGCRLLVKSPGFTITALLTLTLAIGSTTAVFTVVDSVLLRPLNFPDSGALVVAWERLSAMSADPVGPNHRIDSCIKIVSTVRRPLRRDSRNAPRYDVIWIEPVGLSPSARQSLATIS